MTDRMAEIIVALAECNMNLSMAAKSIYMHRNSCWYYIYKMRSELGKDPLNFYDLCELLPLAKSIMDTSRTEKTLM